MASRKRSLSNDSDVSALIKEWDDTSCPICMDHPHNAVLLICSSHSQGCRSYICDTSYRHSNCLDRFKKLKEEIADPSSLPPPIPPPEALNDSIDVSNGPVDLETWIQASGFQVDLTGTESAAEMGVGAAEGSGSGGQDVNFDSGVQAAAAIIGSGDLGDNSIEKSEDWSNLRCPLCRGTVLGWKVVEDARKYLNLKSRSCSRDSCLFTGNYRELRRHARRVHPTVRPADVDPSRQRAWRRLEDQREYNDIVSAIQSAMPGAVVLGDYVIENGDRLNVERDRGGGGGAGQGGRWLSTFFLFHMIGSMDPGAELRGARPRVLPRHRRAVGALSRRRYLWGENLLGLQNDDDDDEEDDDEEENEREVNVVGDLNEDGSPNRRRRRRLTRSEEEEDQQ
ncbi:uncharacterized protein LOC127258952 [Andrographis paniculata]|uniref:uncharacterized protein LOC127258952 n=1 Tax=Andrographis paniculata TaxID=175694 RepID=UPI0021E73A99|nr:uncharacterized protein LOC127258952 [Andrographis paniculata]XP_051142003.1 uncharacterized protein LOC127258952 [Andrographis paniculata]XP_051142004.1 uncharacterized protein LOC127258952 [Andrographis paniculata]